MKRSSLIILSLAAILLFGISFEIVANVRAHAALAPQTVQTAQLASEVTAPGSVTPQNEAVLHFQISGTLVSLPVKVGDQVSAGETIAALDSTQASQAVGEAQANLKSAQSALNLVLDNIHLFQYGNGGFSNVGSANETETQKTQREEAQAAVTAAQDALSSAEQTLSQYSLTAPFDGVITHEDVTSAGVNVTPTITFTVSDPSSVVFQAQVSDSDISAINQGAQATILLNDARNTSLTGTVAKIYPDTITTTSGETAYKVDIIVPSLLNVAKLGTNGTVLIKASSIGAITEVPTWTVLNDQYVWVMENNHPLLKKVDVGQTQNGKTQILGGLTNQDKVITDPKLIISGEYPIL